MAEFNLAIPITLQNEGGYVNDPLDPGGETKYGISKRSYPTVDIKNLTVEQATAIYLRDFWRYDGIIDQLIANKVFDMHVNMGNAAIFYIQELALKVVKPDGLYGPVTEEAINRMDANALLLLYKARLRQHYLDIVEAKPTDEKFLNDWLRRAAQ
jgi:lysozyme family protein